MNYAKLYIFVMNFNCYGSSYGSLMRAMSKNSRWISLLLKNHLASDMLLSLYMVARMFLLQMRIRCSMFTPLLIINLIDRSLVVHHVISSFLGDISCLVVMLLMRKVDLTYICDFFRK